MQNQQATIVHALAAAAALRPEREALRFISSKGPGLALSFGELWSDACNAAAHLRAAGVLRRDHVAMMLPPGPDFVASFFGVLLAGGVPTPLAPPLRVGEVAGVIEGLGPILDDCAARFIIAAPDTVDDIAARRPGAKVLPATHLAVTPAPAFAHQLPEPDDIGVLQYTSGPHTSPRGVRLEHRSIMANITAIARRLQLSPSDTSVSWLPMFADMGLIGVLLAGIATGMRQVHLRPEAFLVRPARWLQAISEYQATLSCAPNFGYALTARRARDRELADVDLSSWRIALVGAEMVEPPTLEVFSARFGHLGFDRRALIPTYGLAENTLAVSIGDPGEGIATQRIGGRLVASAGRPLPGQEVRIFEPEGAALPEGVVGEICVRSNSLMLGYHQRPAETLATMRRGWLWTGDRGALIDGELFVTGRSKRLVIKRGRNYHPADVERIASTVWAVPLNTVRAFARANPSTGTEDLVVEAVVLEDRGTRENEAVAALNRSLLTTLGIRADEVLWRHPDPASTALARAEA